jgi:hypothetical protein
MLASSRAWRTFTAVAVDLVLAIVRVGLGSSADKQWALPVVGSALRRHRRRLAFTYLTLCFSCCAAVSAEFVPVGCDKMAK